MTLYTNNAEGGSNGTAVSTGNSGGASGVAWSAVSAGAGGSIVYSSTSPIGGSLSYLSTPASGVANYRVWTLPSAATAAFAFRYRLRLTGYPSSATNWLDLGHGTTGTSIKINLDTTGVLKVLTGSANTYRGDVSGGALSTGTVYRIEITGTLSTTTGSVTVNVYTDSTNVLFGTYSISSINTNTQINRVIPGKFTATGTMAPYIDDDLAFDDSSNTQIGPVPGNAAPTANAGADQAVNTSTTVTLNGTGSSDSDGTIASYAWTQVSGTTVTLSSTTAASPTFTAPASAATLVFGLVVTDNLGATSSQDTVQIAVSVPSSTTVTRFGTSGGVQTNTATYNTLPPSIPAGALMALFITSDSASIPTTFSGWTLRTPGVVSGGSMNGVIYTKLAAGTEGGTAVSLTGITGGTKGISWVDVWTIAAGQSFALAVNSGADTDSTSTAFSAAGASWTTIADDAVDALAVALTTGTFSGHLSAPSLTQSGATHTATHRFAGTTGTSTVAYESIDAQVTTGSTGTPMLAATTAGANATGLAMFLRIRASSATVDAGPDQASIEPWVATVTLAGTSSNGTYAWTQTAGSTVTLSATNVAGPTFTAPAGLASGETLTFQLSNGAGLTDTVSVAILPAVEFVCNGTTWTPTRWRVWNGTTWV